MLQVATETVHYLNLDLTVVCVDSLCEILFNQRMSVITGCVLISFGVKY